MTTVRQIVTAAYVRGGLADARRPLDASQAEQGLELLADLYQELIGEGYFGRLTDVAYYENATATPGQRITVSDTDAITITLPTYVYDPEYEAGDGETANQRPIVEGSIVVVQDIYSTYLATYISHAGYWTRIEDLTLDSEAPLTPKYNKGLKAALTVRLLDANQQPVSRILTADAITGLNSIRARRDAAIRPAEYSFM